MRVLICGGTGFLGRHIVNALALLDHDPVVQAPKSRGGWLWRLHHGRGMA